MSVVRYELADSNRIAPHLPGCTGKNPMPRLAAERSAARFREGGKPATAYRCAHCSQWHVGGRQPFQKTPLRRRTG